MDISTSMHGSAGKSWFSIMPQIGIAECEKDNTIALSYNSTYYFDYHA